MINEVKILDRNISFFLDQLFFWSKNNFRKYPWRETNNPYDILIAEILLQKTKSDKVFSVFSEFIHKYNNFQKIVIDDDQNIEKILKPLGLYRKKTRYLKKLSTEILNKYDGKIPLFVNELKKILIIGDYTANAFLCFSEGKKVILMDINIKRVIGRFFNLKSNYEDTLEEIIENVLDQDIKLFYWTLLDLGGLICVKKPLCYKCPLKLKCQFIVNSN
jgi:A/G-specific adenine glycosylase